MDLEGGPKSFLMILAGKALVKGALTSDQKNRLFENMETQAYLTLPWR